MAMSGHNNSAALTGTQHLMKSTEGLNKTMERLSTGMKINSAADGASGLVTSEYQRSHISGLKGGISNIDRAVAMVQMAESGMQEVNSLLIKLREVAVNSANGGTLDGNATAANQASVTSLLESIDRIADTTKFGTKNLLDGTATINIESVETENLGTNAVDDNGVALMFSSLSAIQVDSAAEATDAIGVIDKAIEQVSPARGDLGSFQSNTLEATQAKMRVELKNLTEAESQLRDTDFETEIAEFTAAQIRQQVATAVLSSANQQPQMILSLLRG